MSVKRIFVILLIFCICFLSGCRKKTAAEIHEIPVNVNDFILAGLYDRPIANEAAVEAAFTLDFRPLKAEPVNEAEILSAQALSSVTSSSGSVTGGGLRKLADYKTEYFDPLQDNARIQAVRAAQTAAMQTGVSAANNEPLTVIDWGPRGDYSSAIQRPSVYVIFSQPIVALASLGEQSASSPVISINPPIKGTFRWYGTNFLSFEGEEPCAAQQEYKITVAANVSSVYGNRLSGDRVFSFFTEALSVKNVIPGESFSKNNNMYFDNNNVPPPAARQISLEFNYPVQAGDISQYMEIYTGNTQKRFTLKQENEYKIIAEISDTVDFNTQVRIVLKQGAKSRSGSRGTEFDQIHSFRTPGPFTVTSHNRWPGYGRYTNLVEISFSHALNENVTRNAVSIEPALVFSRDNIEVSGNTLRIINLPVKFNDRFAVKISTAAEDIFGRKLSESYTANIIMPEEPPPQGEVNFLDYRRHTILEAQFPPRYLFEYRNITANSGYQLIKRNNPIITAESVWSSASNFQLTPKQPNQRYFEEIDLKPYLREHGKMFVGFVGFRTEMELLTSDWQRDGTYRAGTRKIESMYSIQVTDLGVTVRYGINKAVVLVTSLSTGKPIEGAVVKILPPAANNSGLDTIVTSNAIAEAKTNGNGLAVLSFNPVMTKLRSQTENGSSWRGFDEPFVMVENGNADKVLYTPSSHNTWAFGFGSAIPQRAVEVTPLAFLFSDRGLYKPGETLTFRGVDRSKVLGMYTIYNGDYTIIFEENTYRPAQIKTIHGVTTESGSFFGKVEIPDDLTPGDYRLIYKRGDGSDNEIIANIPVTVAFFERLKFQASLSSPAAPVIMGDDINLNLQASYLSGGSLSGASWESAWYEQQTSFRPQNADTRNFIFGPSRGWDSMRYISSQSGILSGQGTASISQKTGGSKITGSPYIYQAEARVTDISNQMISASRSVIAHPASFYIGLYRQVSGFSRAGQEVSFDYITVNTSGEKTPNNALFLQSGEGAGQIKAELIREEWRRVQQRGVSGYIYDEYTSQKITDSTQTISIRNGGGKISVKPSSAGYHILRVTSADREGRTALTEFTFYVTGSGGYWNMSNPSEIRLTADQNVYEPGDTAKVLLQSALPEGYYLITVEREGIYSEEVRYLNESVTVLDIPIARNYVPVVYVAVSSYSIRSGPPTHEYGSPDLDKPKGYFGVTRLNINPRVRAFSVKAESDKKTYRPGEEVTMTLTATRDGKPLPNAELSLMAVDRGVLDLINYHVPDPIEYFYSEYRFPLSVAGGDSRSWLMDPVTYSVKNLQGGDSEGDSKIEERKDFNPTAVFEPMLITDANGKVTCKFKLPDNLTTYRVTVFGVRGDLFALKESEIAAQNRINVREVVPRRLRERDTAEAGVLITNLDSQSHTLTVSLNVGNPLAADASSGILKMTGSAFVDGNAERRITVKSGENTVVYFDVAGVKEGTVTLNFTVRSDILNERLIREMTVERPYVFETVTTTGTVTAANASEGVVIPSFADNNAGSLTVTLDATRLALLDSAINYIFRYPYGCLEQRTAAIMPLVVFGEYLDALSLKSEVSNPRRVVENEMRSWAQIQLSNGGFPYWPSSIRSDLYVSLRVAHVIAIAKSKNMNIPSSINITSLVAYLNREYQEIQKWQNGNSSYNYHNYQSYLQSYILYVMSLLGERVDPSRLAEILSRSNVDPSVLAFAGMTYMELGRSGDADNTARRLRNLIRLTARGADLTDPLAGSRSSFYGGNIEQLALTLHFFAQQFPGDDINTRLLFSLIEFQRSDSGWQNTADVFRILSAVDALIKAENLENIDVRGSVSLGSAELLQGAFRGLGAKPVTRTFDFGSSQIAGIARDRTQTLNFTRSGNGNLYYTASLRYAIPSELQSGCDEGIGVFMSIYDIATGEEIKGSALKSGKTYRARVRLSSSRDRTYLALRVPVPSGAEILDAAFVTTASYADMGGTGGEDAGYGNSSWISHQAIMDNEVQYFWDRFYRGENTVNFLFRTARRGVYPTPPVQAECMYEPEIFGRTRGLLYTIE
ncbi:MAG: alpha-2-macroglobulin [Treponema sp.]|nr:alpha-2-macroglobulin [Treponema sp.]MCL2271548.1 alpha-2-macroglobulin [Treponema sp.]